MVILDLIVPLLLALAGFAVCTWIIAGLVRGQRALHRHRAKQRRDQARWDAGE